MAKPSKNEKNGKKTHSQKVMENWYIIPESIPNLLKCEKSLETMEL